MNTLLDVPIQKIASQTFPLARGLTLKRKQVPVSYEKLTEIYEQINTKKGALFSSNFEFIGRYSRWDIGFINPPIEIFSKSNSFTINALNSRGEIIIKYLKDFLDENNNISFNKVTLGSIQGVINKDCEEFMENERTKQPSIFTLIREIKDLFNSNHDKFLGIYGSFGYDLIHQFENIDYCKERDIDSKDIHVYIPDEIIIIDRKIAKSFLLSYDFEYKGEKTDNLKREGLEYPYSHDNINPIPEYKPGYYADLVRKASISFKAGDLFEVVPTQVIYKKYSSTPVEVYKRLKKSNPSPYGFIINLGGEFLVGCSPEMYVRVEKNRVETCPISGTIKRGSNAIEDSENIKQLLNSYKDEAELTMCTDVDRNDKSRICKPGTVTVIGRRQVEKYSHLFHTVDHIEGELDDGYNALDAFMTHMWAVTVTGAPKLEAMKWIEKNEETPRRWYGGAVGWFGFDGSLNTGLTLRTMRLKDGIAEIRVGATLLYDSIPEEEEEETLIKSKALVEALEPGQLNKDNNNYQVQKFGKNLKILIVDHEDSFVHNLANYTKQTGAETVVYRSESARRLLEKENDFDLVILSPGPGNPSRFKLEETIQLCVSKKIPLFGICLGFQGIVEFFGGELNLLNVPKHGKKSKVYLQDKTELFANINSPFQVGRYHSIYAQSISEQMKVTGMSDDGIIMSAEHKELPIAGIQFHPESIMTFDDNNGIKIIENVINYLV